jgi:hypothetical protein
MKNELIETELDGYSHKILQLLDRENLYIPKWEDGYLDKLNKEFLDKEHISIQFDSFSFYTLFVTKSEVSLYFRGTSIYSIKDQKVLNLIIFKIEDRLNEKRKEELKKQEEALKDFLLL